MIYSVHTDSNWWKNFTYSWHWTCVIWLMGNLHVIKIFKVSVLHTNLKTYTFNHSYLFVSSALLLKISLTYSALKFKPITTITFETWISLTLKRLCGVFATDSRHSRTSIKSQLTSSAGLYRRLRRGKVSIFKLHYNPLTHRHIIQGNWCIIVTLSPFSLELKCLWILWDAAESPTSNEDYFVDLKVKNWLKIMNISGTVALRANVVDLLLKSDEARFLWCEFWKK